MKYKLFIVSEHKILISNFHGETLQTLSLQVMVIVISPMRPFKTPCVLRECREKQSVR